jgi:hypothetical protein
MPELPDRVSPKDLSPDERKARLERQREDGQRAMQEYAAAQKAFHANRERLRAERLAREAASAKGKTARRA